jgi:hypothetical protein
MRRREPSIDALRWFALAHVVPIPGGPAELPPGATGGYLLVGALAPTRARFEERVAEVLKDDGLGVTGYEDVTHEVADLFDTEDQRREWRDGVDAGGVLTGSELSVY